ncbi:hypothetical protein [Streptosporangium sp. NPDC003464]
MADLSAVRHDSAAFRDLATAGQVTGRSSGSPAGPPTHRAGAAGRARG